MTKSRRRIVRGGITLLVATIVWFGVNWIGRNLGDESTFTGCVLLLSTLSLYLLTIRKRITSRRMGAVSGWMQLHSYAGVFASIVFLMHVHWPIRGPFELCLASCFCFVAGSGIVLGILSRLTPAKLAAIKQDFALEQIPQLQLAVASDAHKLAMKSTELGEGATLSEYYQRKLLPYFQVQRGLFYRLMPTGNKRRQLHRELEDLDRYLAAEGVRYRRGLSAMVQSKDDLDYHFALQTRLRLFYTAHVALTWSLLILVAVHVVMVVQFSGAML